MVLVGADRDYSQPRVLHLRDVPWSSRRRGGGLGFLSPVQRPDGLGSVTRGNQLGDLLPRNMEQRLMLHAVDIPVPQQRERSRRRYPSNFLRDRLLPKGAYWKASEFHLPRTSMGLRLWQGGRL